MGHCLSCFKAQHTADITTAPHRKKDELTEIVSTHHIPALIASDYPQEEPLLHSNDNIINCFKNSCNLQNANIINTLGEPCPGDDSNTSKSNTSCDKDKDKNPKLFYQKLPSIPRTMSSLGSTERISEPKIHQLFDQYKDSDDAMLAEGIESLCNDLQLNPDDFKVLVLAWKLNASQMCRFTNTEFVQGLKNMKTDSIKGIQQKLNDITNELKRDSEQFKDFYRFTFKFGLDVNSGQRILPVDIATALWRLVFTDNEPPILNRWLSYLEKNPHIRGIPKDTWYMFLNFCEYVGEDLSSYDDTEAWPSLFDDFVEHENDQMNQNVTKTDIKIRD